MMYQDDSLIYIISQPRSGSTLLQRMLSVHPEITTAAETWIMLHPIYGLRKKGIWTDYNHDVAYKAVRDFLNLHCGGEHAYYEAIKAFAQLLYDRALVKSGKKLFLDKAPPYSRLVEELPMIFPRAKFIFLLRNPIAVMYSCIETWIKEEWHNLWWLGYDLLESPSNILRGIEELNNRCFVLHYEDLVTRPNAILTKLCKYLHVDYFEEMTKYGDYPPPLGMGGEKLSNQLALMGDQNGIHSHREPVKHSINRWKIVTTCDQRCHFGLSYLEELGRDTVEKLGYSYDELETKLRLAYSKSSRPLIPWGIAIKEPSKRSLSEVLKLQWADSLQKNGFLRGVIHFIRNNSLRILSYALRIRK